jgi:hypothetical protein
MKLEPTPAMAVLLSSVESIHSAKADLSAYFDEQLPYQPVMAV